MVIGYARVHSRDRDLKLQRAVLAGARCERVIEVTQRGAGAHREALKGVLGMLHQGDTLVVRKLARLANGLNQLMEVSAILQERGISLRIMEDGLEPTGFADELIGHMVAALADYERARSQDRMAASSPPEHVTGRRRGRPSGPNEAKREAALALKSENAYSVTEICRMVGISRPTFYRYERMERPEPPKSAVPPRVESAAQSRR